MTKSGYLSRNLYKNLAGTLRVTFFCVAAGMSANSSGMPISLSKAQFNAEIAVLTAVISRAT